MAEKETPYWIKLREDLEEDLNEILGEEDFLEELAEESILVIKSEKNGEEPIAR